MTEYEVGVPLPKGRCANRRAKQRWLWAKMPGSSLAELVERVNKDDPLWRETKHRIRPLTPERRTHYAASGFDIRLEVV
jgi:hypothetical protein